MLRFGAQKTGGPTHLMSQAWETMFRVLGRARATWQPRYGWSFVTPWATRSVDWPLKRLCIASKWLLIAPGCCIELISVNWSVTFASSVCISLIRMPGTRVAIGSYGPRIDIGA